MEILLVLVLIAVAILAIGAPLRRRAAHEAADRTERAELEAARDAKYAEIRDAEMDYRTGKLSEADWRAMDRRLRHEAVELLHRLDAVEDPAERA